MQGTLEVLRGWIPNPTGTPTEIWLTRADLDRMDADTRERVLSNRARYVDLMPYLQ